MLPSMLRGALESSQNVPAAADWMLKASRACRVADIAGPLLWSEEGFEIIDEDHSLAVYLRAVCSEGWEAAWTRKFRRCAPVVCVTKFPSGFPRDLIPLEIHVAWCWRPHERTKSAALRSLCTKA